MQYFTAKRGELSVLTQRCGVAFDCERVCTAFMISCRPAEAFGQVCRPIGIARHMENKIIDKLLRYRYGLALLSLVLSVALAYGAREIYLEADYKIYFKKDNPYLLAHEEMQESYTTSDNIVLGFRSATDSIYTPRNLQIVTELTEHLWQTPYVIRVDSLSNFQNTSADGDDLLVQDLVDEFNTLDAAELARIRRVAEDEPLLYNRTISKDGNTTTINVTLELPPEVDPTADKLTQAEQRTARDASFLEVVSFGRELVTEYEARYPDLEMHLSGMAVVTNSFTESAVKDLSSLVPLMYLVIILTLALFLRSAGSVVGTLLVIACASIASVGAAGWLGYALNTVNVTAPTIVLTIAVCDSVHLLVVYLRALGQQLSPLEAMRESMRLNLQPIVLTSVTTAVGFLTLNFSISPPFVELGNMTAAGVLWAMVLTFTLLPAVTMLLVRKRKARPANDLLLGRFSRFVVANRNRALAGSIIVAVLLMSFIPLNKINDDPISYFKPGVPFRDASEFFMETLPGVKDFNFSIDCGVPGCVNNVDFLHKLESFENWLSAQPGIEHVAEYSGVIKRLNRSMNGDDPAYYRIPDDNDLTAQYNLMYEMSLPYGLDLNNQLNIDKSATRVSILASNMATDEFINLEKQARQWLHDNHPEIESPGASVSIMFAQVGVQNIDSMLLGAVFAVIGVTLTILIALRSFRYALISMIPNSLPALMAFGVWGVLVGQVNMAVAAVFSISLGILVDDTVHFISKYRRAREVKGLSTEEAVHYAFENVGSALIVTTVVLVIGFGLLSLSDFNLNSMAGMLTGITIAIALVFDFFILPPLLVSFDRDLRAQN